MMTLDDVFRSASRPALAFSGGVDSAYLLYSAHQAGVPVQPYFVQTAFQPAFALHHAQRCCKELGISLQVIPLDVLSDPEIASNGPRRCYFCKRRMLCAVLEAAKQDGCAELWDGSNASDDADNRPGMQALTELGVISPLRLCGLDKKEIRRRSRQAGLFTWNLPAYSCLATRITGQPLAEADLQRVEQAEHALQKLGFHDLRVRLHGDDARLELDDFALAMRRRQEILDALRPLFTHISLDLEGRA